MEEKGNSDIRVIELLAPAASLEVGKVALSAGADAVYIGAPKFGARASAGVSIEDIQELCQEAHIYGAKVYVALNTILTDDELTEAKELVTRIYEAGADALIVQDMGLCSSDLPPLPLHASTQCHNNSRGQLKLLEDIGFEQVVLPREWSCRDIAKVRGITSMRLEAFIHGALCVSYSGRCYISEACQGRSANRGACAQYCRMTYDIEDKLGNKLYRNQHLLSLRDLNRSEILEDMLDAGITSFKIEGRLKGIDYVRNVTSHYRILLDEIINRRSSEYRRSSFGKTALSFSPNPQGTFSRLYTSYNTPLHQPIQISEFTPFTNKSVGEEVGTLISRKGKKVTIKVAFRGIDLANGDGLLFISNNDSVVSGAYVNQISEEKERGTKKLLLSQEVSANMGCKIYRNHNHKLTQLLLKPNASTRSVPIDISCLANNSGITLMAIEVKRSTLRAEVHTEIVLEKAKRDHSVQIERTLSKLGDSHYTLRNLEIDNGGYYLPPSILTDLRRRLVDQLEQQSQDYAKAKRDRVGILLREKKRRFLSTHHSRECYELPKELDFTYNVANKEAERFYRISGVDGTITPALEVQRPKGSIPVMFTRHCLRHALGYCTKDGVKPPFSLPMYLVRGNERFRIETDCKECCMILWQD